MRRLRREPAENMATIQLRDAILSGSLRPGTRLRQEELAARLGVSRMPVRQALSVLEREGLVRTEPWRGTIVSPLDGQMIRDLYAFRAIVERQIAESLASQPDYDASSFQSLLKEGKAAVDGEPLRLIELDFRFHSRLYEAFGNRVLLQVMHEQWAHIRRMVAFSLKSEYRERIWDEHAAIIDAIAAHEPERAGRLAAAHMEAASANITKNLAKLMARSEGNGDNGELRRMAAAGRD